MTTRRETHVPVSIQKDGDRYYVLMSIDNEELRAPVARETLLRILTEMVRELERHDN